MMASRLFVAFALAGALALPAHAASLLMLPPESLDGGDSGAEMVQSIVAGHLAEKGWSIVPPSDVEELLTSRRIRYVDALSESDRTFLLEKTAASAVLSTTVYSLRGGANPSIAISARLTGVSGLMEWSNVVSLSADDTERLLGYGRSASPDAITITAVESLFRGFPAPGAASRPVPGLIQRSSGPKTVAYRSPDLASSGKMRVCVLPFDNLSDGAAGRVVGDVLTLRLAAVRGYEVVDPAELRAAALKARIASFRTVNPDTLRRLGDVLGTHLFLKGSIYAYVDPSSSRAGSSPAIELEFSLIDVASSKVLWTVQSEKDGSDYVGLLMRGGATTVGRLADRVISEMIETGIPSTTRAASRRTKRRSLLAQSARREDRSVKPGEKK